MKIVQMVRYVTAIAQSYIGPVGQIVVDLGSKAIRVQDGATLGGFSTMLANNNLSDLSDVAAARNNLQLGSAALHPSGDFDAAGSAATALAAAEAYTDVETANRITAVTAAIATAEAASNQRANNLSDVAVVATSRNNLSVYSKAQTDGQSFTNQAGVVSLNAGAPVPIATHNGSGGGFVMVEGNDGAGSNFVDMVPYFQFGGGGSGNFTFITTDPGWNFGVRSYGGGGTASLYLTRNGGPASVNIICRYLPL